MPAVTKKKNIACTILTATFLVFVLFSAGPFSYAAESDGIDAVRQIGKAFVEIAEKSSPAVVGLFSEKIVVSRYSPMRQRPFGDPFDDDFFDFFFRRHFPQRRPQPRSRPKSRQMTQGSGFIVSSDGYILTNNHLVREAEKVTIKLSDGREFKNAKVIGTDPESDVAVVKIDAEGLSFLELADSDKLKVGEWVLAIGNPFGLSHTVTSGIVSATGRRMGLSEYEDFIQTDAAINPGNSGGPLINLDGKVVGINTAIVTRTGGSMGIGMAIPINMARSVYQQLVEGGTVERGALGVYIDQLTPDMARSLGMEDTKGVVIADVMKDSAAEKAGMKRYDVVTEFEGEKVETPNELRNRVAMLKPGTKVKLVIVRDGKRRDVTTKLGKRSEQLLAGANSKALEKLGFTVENLTDELAERFGYEGLGGVIVTKVEPGSSAAQAGIRPGTLIQEVNRKKVSNIKDFSSAMEKAAKNESVLLLAYNGRYTQLILLPLSED